MVRKTVEERVAVLDEKIAKKQAEIDALEAHQQQVFFAWLSVAHHSDIFLCDFPNQIDALEAQKQRLLHPVNMKTVMAAAKEAGLTPEESQQYLNFNAIFWQMRLVRHGE